MTEQDAEHLVARGREPHLLKAGGAGRALLSRDKLADGVEELALVDQTENELHGFFGLHVLSPLGHFQFLPLFAERAKLLLREVQADAATYFTSRLLHPPKALPNHLHRALRHLRDTFRSSFTDTGRTQGATPKCVWLFIAVLSQRFFLLGEAFCPEVLLLGTLAYPCWLLLDNVDEWRLHKFFEQGENEVSHFSHLVLDRRSAQLAEKSKTGEGHKLGVNLYNRYQLAHVEFRVGLHLLDGLLTQHKARVVFDFGDCALSFLGGQCCDSGL